MRDSPRTTVATVTRISALAACVLASCTRLPESTPPVEGPAPHLRGTADTNPTGSRDEPAIDVPDPDVVTEVTLTQILAFADHNSPVLLVARATRSRAEAERVAAAPRLYANPEVSAAVGPRIGGGRVGVDVQVSLWQQVQIAGERKLRIAAADRLRQLTDADIEQIRWNVHCDVHAAFHQALVDRERASLSARVVEFQSEVLRIVERQIAAGETAKLSLRLAEAEAAQAKQARLAAEQAYRVSRIRLAQLAGWPAARAPQAAGSPDLPREPPSTERLVATAKRELPLLRAREAAVDEAQARVSVARRERIPRPSFGLQYQREGNPSPESPYNIVLGGVAFAIPSFQTNQGERARASADVRVANAELEASHFLLEGQIVQARSELVAASERVNSYGTEILPRFEENLGLLRRSFELGEIDLLSLSVGRERFMRIQSDALIAQLDYFVALAALERVIGIDVWLDQAHETRSDP
jgi:cobalt-zinc-cadmium efflux system outer membrane protein